MILTAPIPQAELDQWALWRKWDDYEEYYGQPHMRGAMGIILFMMGVYEVGAFTLTP